MALANFIPRAPHKVARIAGLGTHCLMSWPDDSSSEEEGDDNDQAEEGDYGNGQVEGEGDDPEEEDPTNLEEPGESLSGSVGLKQGETE